MVECGGLENRLACIRSRGFESLPLRQNIFLLKSLYFNDTGSFLLFWQVLQEERKDHLPFSQMPGCTGLETGKGELHGDTVQQAISAGVLPASPSPDQKQCLPFPSDN